MDYVDFMMAMEGWNEARETQEKLEWERTRWLAAVMLSPHGKKGRPIQPEDLIRFPWDGKRKKKKLTEAEKKQARDLLMSIAKPSKA